MEAGDINTETTPGPGPVDGNAGTAHRADITARVLGDVELVLVAYRSRAQVEDLLSGLPASLPIAVVDNSDTDDGLSEVVAARPGGRYLRGGGVGFARAANLGARTSDAAVVVFVNPDIRPTAEQLAALVDDVVADPSLAGCAGTLVEADGRAQIGVAGWEPSLRRALVHALGLHKVFPEAGMYARPALGKSYRVDWTSGACMAVRRETFLRLGCFDEDFYVYLEDVAYGRAARAAGLSQRLRTDIAVPGDSGGSGAPSLEMMRLRGASLARYLRKHHATPVAASIRLVYGAGYAGRALLCAVTGRRRRAGEHIALVAGVATARATVGGRSVTE